MKVRFLGAAGNVTGSRFLLTTQRSKILIDCGLYQERKFLWRNWKKFPTNPSSIRSVLLTHAHIDHCGYLPKLVRAGFRDKIFCTQPTAEISKIALLDAASLQEADAAFKRKRHRKERRKGPHPEVPLYTTEEARRTFRHFRKVPYKKEIQVCPDIKAVFHDAGHILGSAIIELRIREAREEKICVFSGDMGRWDKPILCDPTIIKRADYVFIESTYSDRNHDSVSSCARKLEEVINETYQEGGNIIIPTFCIERAQELLYYISQLLKKDKIPHILCFLDSPMAIDVTEAFERYPQFFDTETQERLNNCDSPFNFPLLKMTRSQEESKTINHIKGTTIIMAGAGMCNGGRIKHHLVRNITRPESTILFVSYQANGTLGRQILERHHYVRILGQSYSLKANVEKINGFSAHAGKNELLRWLSGFKKIPKKIFIVHGEKNVSHKFASVLRKRLIQKDRPYLDSLRKGLKSTVIIPEYLQEYVL